MKGARLARAAALGTLALTGSLAAQEPSGRGSSSDAADLINVLLAGLMGGGEVTAARLQQEVAEAGGIPFRRDVPIAFLRPEELRAYLQNVLDSDYPPEQARADERLLTALDLLSVGTDLRRLRARLLEDNVVGFYDERPGRRRLYAVSTDKTFTPMNQIILAHELRHALQDQYEDLHAKLGEDVSDFDDRRVAWMAVLEGDATLVMERFLKMRLGLDASSGAGAPSGGAGLGIPPGLDLPDAPPVLRDHLLQPYLAGRDFAQALWARGGAEALREAWRNPPASTEQVLHPEKYVAREAPRPVPLPPGPPGGRVLSQGVLGEILLRTLVEEETGRAAAGWGGDSWRLYDAGGRTFLAWSSVWDTAEDAHEIHDALLARFLARKGTGRGHRGWLLFAGGPWRWAVRRISDRVDLVSSDDAALVEAVLAASPGQP